MESICSRYMIKKENAVDGEVRLYLSSNKSIIC